MVSEQQSKFVKVGGCITDLVDVGEDLWSQFNNGKGTHMLHCDDIPMTALWPHSH